MSQSRVLQQLMDALRCLPGVGPKTAARTAYYLLERNRDGARHLADTLLEALERLGHCEHCRILTEHTLCDICSQPSRDDDVLCVVESPMDVHNIEKSGQYKGKYFVLGGLLSPLDGVGPENIGLDHLEKRVREGGPKEIILAVSATVEGEATCHYIAQRFAQSELRLSRIAQGVPVGGHLDYVDGNTLARSLSERRPYH
jgi:recombination protein RecR